VLVLQAYGWEEARRRGSHVTFRKAGEMPIVVPLVSGRKAKRRYLDMICERLGLDD
jgi:predicted RNA binding protein YcfA (HicA-like mRNA interferase family)